jgi:hypothetical protein
MSGFYISRLLGSLGLFLFLAAVSDAQLSRGVLVNIDSSPVMSLELDKNSLDFSLPKQFSKQPVEKTNAVTVRIRSNVNWELTVAANGDLTNTDNITATIPCSRLEYRARPSVSTVLVGNQIYQPFSAGNPTIVASGGATADEGICLFLDFRYLASLSDPAGTYTLSLTYTLNHAQ